MLKTAFLAVALLIAALCGEKGPTCDELVAKAAHAISEAEKSEDGSYTQAQRKHEAFRTMEAMLDKGCEPPD